MKLYNSPEVRSGQKTENVHKFSSSAVNQGLGGRMPGGGGPDGQRQTVFRRLFQIKPQLQAYLKKGTPVTP